MHIHNRWLERVDCHLRWLLIKALYRSWIGGRVSRHKWLSMISLLMKRLLRVYRSWLIGLICLISRRSSRWVNIIYIAVISLCLGNISFISILRKWLKIKGVLVVIIIIRVTLEGWIKGLIILLAFNRIIRIRLIWMIWLSISHLILSLRIMNCLLIKCRIISLRKKSCRMRMLIFHLIGRLVILKSLIIFLLTFVSLLLIIIKD